MQQCGFQTLQTIYFQSKAHKGILVPWRTKNSMQWERDLFYLFLSSDTIYTLWLTPGFSQTHETLLRPPDFSLNGLVLPGSWSSSLQGANSKCETEPADMSWTTHMSPQWQKQQFEVAWIIFCNVVGWGLLEPRLITWPALTQQEEMKGGYFFISAATAL